MRLFKHEKYHNLTAELHHLLKSFNEKFYVCETCHKHIHPILAGVFVPLYFGWGEGGQ